jgi:hypothetical protein
VITVNEPSWIPAKIFCFPEGRDLDVAVFCKSPVGEIEDTHCWTIRVGLIEVPSPEASRSYAPCPECGNCVDVSPISIPEDLDDR